MKSALKAPSQRSADIALGNQRDSVENYRL
jgi:hypothetical protein